MRSILCLAILGLILLAFPSCSAMSDKAAADEVMSEAYELIKVKDYDSVLDYYSEEFLLSTTEEEWLTVLNTVNEKLGDLQSYELVAWNLNMKKAGADAYIRLQYDTQYERYEASETVSLVKIGGSGFKINSHSVFSEGLSAE